MSTLALEVPAMPRRGLAEWAARAWRRMGWRHVLLAFALQVLRAIFGPLGGIFFLPGDVPGDVGWGPFTQFLDGRWIVGGVSIVYCVLVANEAFDDGVAPLRAYGLAVIAIVLFVPVADWLVVGFLAGGREPAPVMAWWAQALLLQCGLGVSIYAYWRVTQRAMRQTQAAETERVRNEQRVQTARLLALQSRVEPQVLFDSLGRVRALHVHEPQAADALLADLIALLRAMQPGAKADNSTVEREFALVEAWMSVTRGCAHGGGRIRLRVMPEARSLAIAPMLVLPMVRAVLAASQRRELDWLLSADVAKHRVILTLQPAPGSEVPGLLESADLSALHDRLARLFGRSAPLALAVRSNALTLDLPRLEEDPDDDSADR